MKAVRYLAVADTRRAWRSLVALTLLVAVLGGVVLAFAAGARRTASAYPRLRSELAAPDFVIAPGGPVTGTGGFYDAVAELPGVSGVGTFYGINLFPQADTPYARMVMGASFGGFDDAAFHRVNRPKLLAGRMPTNDDEALANRAFARTARVDVGDVVNVRFVAGEVFYGNEVPDDAGTPVSLRISGVGVFANEVVPFSDLDAMPTLTVTPRFAARAAPEDRAYEGAHVQARPGADLAQLRERIEELAAKDPVVGSDNLFLADLASSGATVQHGLRPLTVALALVALVLTLVGLLAAGQAVARHVHVAPAEAVSLDALGLTGRQRIALVLVRATMIGALGAVGAAVVAIALSPRFPIGVARLAEPNPGVHVDWVVLGLGLPAVVIGVVAMSVPTAISGARSRRSTPTGRSSRVSGLITRSGLSTPLVQGTRFALEPGAGPAPVPVRSSVVVAAVAVAAVVASLTYATSLRGLLDTSDRYGQAWDVMLDGSFAPAPVASVVDGLADDDAISGMAAGSYGELVVRGRPIPAIAFKRLTGDVNLTLLEGDLADAPGEVVLGGQTAKRLRVGVGDTIKAQTPTGPATLLVVGRAVFPRFSLGVFSTTGLGEGAQLAQDYVPPTAESGITDIPPGYEYEGRLWNFVVVDLTRDAVAGDGRGARRVEAFLNRVKFVDASVRSNQRPTQITDYDRVRDAPLLLSVLLAGIALVMLAHVLVTSVRARRRDLALLSIFGLRRRQLRATVAWQATAIGLVAVLIGAPLGVAAGRTVWHSFASGLYVEPTPTTPLLALAGVIVAVLVAANVVAAIPGRAASRVRPAIALRSE